MFTISTNLLFVKQNKLKCSNNLKKNKKNKYV